MGVQRKVGLVAAALIAALLPAAVFAMVAGSLKILPLAFAVALAHAFVLGLPLFLLLRRAGWANGFSATAAGFGIAALPLGALTWPLNHSGARYSSWIGPERVPTVVDGSPTLAGWLHYLETLAQFGAFGALGGLAFWVAVSRFGLLPARAGSEEPSLAPAPGGSRPSVLWKTPSWRIAVFAGVFVIAAGIFLIPTITKDRTCHNVLRDGRSHISAKVGIDLQIPDEEWPVLVKRLQDFAREQDLSFRDSSEVRPGVLRTLYLSLCSEAGITITTVEQRWAHNGFKNLVTGRGVGIALYQVRDSADWRQLARLMISDLKEQWPDRVWFRDGLGRVVPMPEELRLD